MARYPDTQPNRSSHRTDEQSPDEQSPDEQSPDEQSPDEQSPDEQGLDDTRPHASEGAEGDLTSSTLQLNPDEKQELLRAVPYCDTCISLIDPGVGECARCGEGRPSEGWPNARADGEVWLGRTIEDTYRITGRLGLGSSGAVYRAESLSVAREFALKIVDPNRATILGEPDKSVRSRIRREIDAQARLTNPYVVSLFDALDLSGDRVAIVMELVTGPTVAEQVRAEGPLSLPRALSALKQAAIAVHEAHQYGIIHRDLKPSNLMLQQLPAGGEFVRVLDFGIAWIQDSPHVTQGFIGTPAYASPEQISDGEVDCRSDVYSLGATFFFMLTGRPPFEGDSVYSLLERQMTEDPPTLAEAAPDRQIPGEVEFLLRRMMARDPSRRPADLCAVVEQIEELNANLTAGIGGGLGAESSSATLDAAVAETMQGSRSEGRTTLQDDDARLNAPTVQVSEQDAPASGLAQSTCRTLEPVRLCRHS